MVVYCLEKKNEEKQFSFIDIFCFMFKDILLLFNIIKGVDF